ncbi:MAG: type II toxin-antitoxin system RelB/DinJ family antitoxin [Candidatus Taylorbacteria bacterium]|nr:type II toxin-antitoxin system RelB/DinJ family antitoxin [Candidatus Taylorbacteria bacterium]
MSIQSATIQLRIDAQTKKRAQSVFKKLGIDISSAMKLFLNQVIKTGSIPFVVRTANGYTPEFERMLLDEIKAMESGKEKSFKSVRDLMADLNS